MKVGPFNRVCLFGGGPLVLRVLERIPQISAFVVSSPRHLSEILFEEKTTFQRVLEQRKVPHCSVENINDQKEWARLNISPQDFCFSLGAPWFVRAETLQGLFPHSLLNVHGTRLPQFRGGGWFSWHILSGIRLGFINIHELQEGLDSGDILYTKEFIYPMQCRTPLDYQQYYFAKTAEVLAELIHKGMREQIGFEKKTQSEYLSTYWPRLQTKTHGWINWEWSLADLDRFICAFDDPYGGAQTFLNGQAVSLKKCFIDSSDGGFHPFQNGIVIRKNAEWLTIAMREGTLLIQSIEDAKNQSLFSKVQVGDRFYTPAEHLEQTSQRVVYSATGSRLSKPPDISV